MIWGEELSTEEMGLWIRTMELEIRGTIDFKLMCLMQVGLRVGRWAVGAWRSACGGASLPWSVVDQKWLGRVKRNLERLPLCIWKGFVFISRGIWLRPSWLTSLSVQQASRSSGTFEKAFSSAVATRCEGLRSVSLMLAVKAFDQLCRCLKYRSRS